MKDVKAQALQEITHAAEAASLVIEKAAVRAADVLAAANSSYGNAVALMGADIARIKEDMREVRDYQKNSEKEFVGIPDFTAHLKADADHETRIRILETTVTRLWTYGTALMFIIGIAEFFISKLWK